MDLIKAGSQVSKMTRDDYPKMGEWYWVKVKKTEVRDEDGETVEEEESKKWKEVLLCVEHIGSNKVGFGRFVGEGGNYTEIHNNEVLSRIRKEPGWKQILEKELADKQEEIKQAVAALADKVSGQGLIVNAEPTTLLPSVTRIDPKEYRKGLVKFKESGFPEAKRDVEYLMKEMVALQKCIYLPQHCELAKLQDAVDTIDERLFALELYAGFKEKIKQVRKGKPAEADTKVTIRQMLRYMDEECLFDYDAGGMDYRKIEDFDRWVSKAGHFNRLFPEPRCVVAFKVRRNPKVYPNPGNFLGWWEQLQDHQANKWTFLYVRNGQQLFRVISEFDFEPRLLPLREAFNRPFEHTSSHYDHSDPKHPFKQIFTTHTITPDDLKYDDYVEARRKEMVQANRILFLIQGLLDRSKVLSPHPPINLSKMDAVQEWCKLVYDEEIGLPSYRPPDWEFYQTHLNSKIKKGTIIYSAVSDKKRRGYGANTRPRILAVVKVKKDRSKVLVKWPWGSRDGYEFGGRRGWGKWGTWEVKKLARQWLPMSKVFNLTDYTPGDYKKFLCDAYLKGAYLKWAPYLLTAERWHHPKTKAEEEKREAPVKWPDKDGRYYDDDDDD